MENKKYTILLILLYCIAVIHCTCQVKNFKHYNSTICDSTNRISVSDVIQIYEPRKIIIYIPFQHFITSNNVITEVTENDNYFNLIYGMKMNLSSFHNISITQKSEIRKLMLSLDSMSYVGVDRSSDCGLAYQLKAIPLRSLLRIEKTTPDLTALIMIFPKEDMSPIILCQTGNVLTYNGYQFRIKSSNNPEHSGYYQRLLRELPKDRISNIYY